MKLEDVPTGAKVSFAKPPPRHSATRVWTMGPYLDTGSARKRTLQNRCRYGYTVSPKEWDEWGGFVVANKKPTASQQVKALKERVSQLENSVSELCNLLTGISAKTGIHDAKYYATALAAIKQSIVHDKPEE